MSLHAPVKIDSQATAACKQCVLAMAYSYNSIEPSTLTQNSSQLSCAPSASVTPMSIGCSSIGLGFREKEKVHLGSVATAQADVFAILGNKIVKILKIFVEVDYLRSRGVLCQP